MKEIIAVCVGIAFLFFTVIASSHYFSAHQSCVRAQMADKANPMSEADAHLTCGRWMNQK